MSFLLAGTVVGCARHQERPMITAVGLSPGNQCEPPGIPYYLPKPLLVVAKNVRHIDDSKVGLTAPVPIPGGFDNQAAYGDIKANVTVPYGEGKQATSGDGVRVSTAKADGTSTREFVPEQMTPSGRVEDGIAPDSFFTYQVVFVPDLTQKYGLQISGGAGEFRAAMNMVNGWMYTGMGPFYMKDSSSAQNAMATGVAAMFAGRGAADVLNEVGELTDVIGRLPGADEGGGITSPSELQQLAAAFQGIADAIETEPTVSQQMLNYAEIYIYEPFLLPDNSTDWRLIAEHHFDRQYFTERDDVATIDAKRKVVQALIAGLGGGMAAALDRQPSDDSAKAEKRSSKNEAGGISEPADGSDELFGEIPARRLPEQFDSPVVPQSGQLDNQSRLDPPDVQINLTQPTGPPPADKTLRESFSRLLHGDTATRQSRRLEATRYREGQ